MACSLFPLLLLFCWLSTVFFFKSEANKTIPLRFQRCFSLFYEKNSSRKTFLVERLRIGATKGAVSYKRLNKRGEFWRETHTLQCLLIGHIIFLIREKKKKRHSSGFLLEVSFSSLVKTIVHSSDWVEFICV